MREPGFVQLAPKEAPEVVPPLALLYDYPLNTWSSNLHLCDQARRALTRDGAELANEPCFRGECPNYDDTLSICPGGFWGYRHRIGIPITIPGEGDGVDDLRQRLRVSPTTGPTVIIGVSIDTDLVLREGHINRLRGRFVPDRLRYAEDRDEVLGQMRNFPAHLVYLYCHGGESNGVPYISVGARETAPIGRDTLGIEHILWTDPHALVFLNGCHTTSVAPERAINLVSGFIERGASGVIGTEITVFEPMATVFAEHFFARFLDSRDSLGEAIRRARLHVLHHALNPLGLVYLPFALGNLAVTDT
jgi:hypothetical protein